MRALQRPLPILIGTIAASHLQPANHVHSNPEFAITRAANPRRRGIPDASAMNVRARL